MQGLSLWDVRLVQKLIQCLLNLRAILHATARSEEDHSSLLPLATGQVCIRQSLLDLSNFLRMNEESGVFCKRAKAPASSSYLTWHSPTHKRPCARLPTSNSNAWTGALEDFLTARASLPKIPPQKVTQRSCSPRIRSSGTGHGRLPAFIQLNKNGAAAGAQLLLSAYCQAFKSRNILQSSPIISSHFQSFPNRLQSFAVTKNLKLRYPWYA